MSKTVSTGCKTTRLKPMLNSVRAGLGVPGLWLLLERILV